ncbi:type IV toxin-antitoxin system AbiEi family antitoxin domain-containing protein, partial [Frankia sp. CcWB3]
MTFSASASPPPTRPVRYPGFDPAVRLAGRQGGAITYRQAMAAGLTRGQLRQLVHSGQWSHPVRGVFVVPLGPTELPGSVDDVPRPGDWRRAEHSETRESEIREKESAGLVRNDVARRRRKRHGAITAGPGHAAPIVGDENTTPILPVFSSPFSARVRAALIGRPRAVVCGITAARLHGFPLAVPESSTEPVHLLLPARQTRAQPRGIRLHFSDLDADQRVELGGIPLTSPERTLADLVLAAQSREAAVAHLDAALHRGLGP